MTKHNIRSIFSIFNPKSKKITESLTEDLDAIITDSEILTIDSNAADHAAGTGRKLCLLACARSTPELKRLRIDEPEAFEDMLSSIESFEEHAKHVAAISSAALMRMLVADTEIE